MRAKRESTLKMSLCVCVFSYLLHKFLTQSRPVKLMTGVESTQYILRWQQNLKSDQLNNNMYKQKRLTIMEVTL